MTNDEVVNLGSVPAGAVCVSVYPPVFIKDNIEYSLDDTGLKLRATISQNTNQQQIKELTHDKR
jgi:hypothetical protein